MLARNPTSWLCFSVILLPLFSADDDIRCVLPFSITPSYGFGNKLNATLDSNEPGVHYAFYCAADFHMEPPGSVRVCQNDGSWSGIDQTCVLNDDARCSDPTDSLPEHSMPYNIPDFYKIFHIMKLSCKAGYVGRGNDTVQCNYLKTWLIDFECKPECGEPPLPSHSAISSSWTERGYAVDEAVPVTCEDGYRLLGLSDITCESDKAWDIKFGCCAVSDDDHGEDVFKSLQSVYKKNSIIIFGPLLFLMLLINVVLVAMLLKKRKRTRTCSKIQVSPAKTPETLSVHKDFKISIDPQPSPPLSIRDIKSQGLVVGNHPVIRDSQYTKLSREHSYNHQYSREDSF